MLDAREIPFLASILNSLICRRPFLIEVAGTAAEARLRHILSFVPAHRWLMVAGQVPKWVKHLPNRPRELQGHTGEELLGAL